MHDIVLTFILLFSILLFCSLFLCWFFSFQPHPLCFLPLFFLPTTPSCFSASSASPRIHLHVVVVLLLMSDITKRACVPAGSPLRGGGVTVYVWHNQPRLPTPFCSVLVSISVFMALSTLFHSINSPDNSLFSHSVLLVLILPYWSFQLYIFLWKSPSALI